MKSILVTGISGFVGGHFTRYLLKENPGCEIHGVSRSVPAWDFFPDSRALQGDITFHQCDLLDAEKLAGILHETNPEYILHLASFSSVAESWTSPRHAFLNNTAAFLNIADTVRKQGLSTRILSVGSSEEYGIVASGDLPLVETRNPDPRNPYAVARVAEEHLARVFVQGYRQDICCTRSFNHIGPGQRDQYVVSSVAKQFAEIAAGKKKPVVQIGDGSIVRDFIDVEDVVRAYYAILERGTAGEVYNVCTGTGHSIRDIVDRLSAITGIQVSVSEDRTRIRPVDNPALVGSYEKLRKATGWAPEKSLDESLQTMYQYWSGRLS